MRKEKKRKIQMMADGREFYMGDEYANAALVEARAHSQL